MEKISGRSVSARGLVDYAVKRSCGALIFCPSTGRYLFLLRSEQTKYAGTWGLVGGKVEAGERITEALFREIDEEIGTDLRDRKIIPIEQFTSDNEKFEYHTYVVMVDSEFVPRLNKEHRGYCWVQIADHPKPLHPGVWRTFNFKEIVKKLDTIELVSTYV